MQHCRQRAAPKSTYEDRGLKELEVRQKTMSKSPDTRKEPRSHVKAAHTLGDIREVDYGLRHQRQHQVGTKRTQPCILEAQTRPMIQRRKRLKLWLVGRGQPGLSVVQ